MLIKDNNELLKFIPNTIKALSTESTLFDKITPQLTLAEKWLTETFLTEKVKESLSDEAPLKQYAQMAIAAEAMLHAVPQLDLILTPNGFGIVSSSNIAPASKERVERLLLSIEKLRDDALTIILTILPTNNAWLSSSPYEYFAATLFPSLDIVTTLGFNDHLWQHYQEIHAQLLPIEQRLAADFFSPELMDYLRTTNIRNKWDETPNPQSYRQLFAKITAIEFSILRTTEWPFPSINDALNLIRNQKESIFPLWHASETAKIFSMQSYQNKKQSAGFFF